MKKISLIILAALLATPVYSQMFSVASTDVRVGPPTTFFSLGYGITDFDYSGNSTQPNSGSLEFNNTNTLFFLFSSPSFELDLSLANKLTGLEDLSYLRLTINYSNRARIIRGNVFSLNLPLVLRTGLNTIAETNNSIEDFSQFTVSLYPGLEIRNRFGSNVVFNNQATAGYGFSSSNGGLFGGSVRGISVRSRLIFVRFIGTRSLSIGYNYDLRDFDIDGSSFDYELSGHTLSIGLSI